MITKCLFPVAGHGTRFLPVTKSIPKEMLPVLNKPLVHYGVEEALAAGMSRIAFVTGEGKQAIEDYFEINHPVANWIRGTPKARSMDALNALIAQCEFSSIRQHEMKGLGDAILTGRPLIGEQPFGVILVDDLCADEDRGVMAQMLEVYRQYRCSIIAIERVAPDVTDQYGIIAGTPLAEGLYRVSDLVEKPDLPDAPSDLAIIGRYILTPDIFDILGETPPGKGGELQVTDALRVQARRGGVIACKFRGRRFDCGGVPGFIAAANFFGNL